jgi:hypothetical protein
MAAIHRVPVIRRKEKLKTSKLIRDMFRYQPGSSPVTLFPSEIMIIYFYCEE